MIIEKKYDHAVEILRFTVKEDLVEKFIAHDHEIWTKELAKVDGFISKDVWINKNKPGEITTVIYWETLEKWKSINHKILEETDTLFNTLIGKGNFSLEGLHENNDYYRVLNTIKIAE